MLRLGKWFNQTFLATTAGRLKLVILISFFSLLAFAASVAGMKAAQDPKFCISCHEMRPEYFTWQASAHNQVSCTSCHVGPGIGNFFASQIGAVNELFRHYTDSYVRPIRMQGEVDNDVCLSCHTVKREVTPSGDIVLPHAKHVQMDISCSQCHGGVSHGSIAGRQLTRDGDYKKWNAASGYAQMTRDNIKPKMQTCMNCHKRLDVTRDCASCHTQIIDVESHKEPNWLQIHGKLAAQELDNCMQCHSYGYVELNQTDPFIGNVSKASEYSRRNSFCADCHGKRPPSHQNGNWAFDHVSAAIDDFIPCLVCHSVGKPTSVTRAPAELYCSQCHLHGSIWLVFGETLLAQEQYYQASIAMDKFLDLNPTSPKGYYYKGLALEQLGRDDEAIRFYRKALNYKTDYADAVEALKRLDDYNYPQQQFDTQLPVMNNQPDKGG